MVERAAPRPSVAARRATRGRVLGVDPGTRMVGYALLDVPAPGRFEYVECGLLDVRRDGDLGMRLLELARGLDELIDEFTPECLAIERAFHGVNSSSALTLAEARGALKLVALRRDLTISEYAPAMVKRAVVGQGRATKVEVQQRVRLLCRLDSTPRPDAADALAIAICHVQASRLPNLDVARKAARRRGARRLGRR